MCYRCTTTPVARGRPRKNVAESVSLGADAAHPEAPADSSQSASGSSASFPVDASSPPVHDTAPVLTPELVSHFFDCFDQLPAVNNPVIIATSIKTVVQAASFNISLLPPQSRTLAMCIIACCSLISFHVAILGPGPRPQSFSDPLFFSEYRDGRRCGARRAAAFNALHAAALKDARDIGIMLEVSTENAASCFILDLLDQREHAGPSRPFAAAYVSHVRALAPMWRASPVPQYRSHWAGFLMSEALLSTRNRKPILITHEDQLLLSGPEPSSVQEFLASLETLANTPGAEIVLQAMKPYAFHITSLARQLWAKIIGDHIRLGPLSEAPVLQFITSLFLMHAILSHLLARADDALAVSGTPQQRPLVLDTESTAEALVRGCAYGMAMGFIELVLPLYRELELRVNAEATDSPPTHAHTLGRMRLLVMQARNMARLAVRELARAIRYLPPVHYAPVQRKLLVDFARFALDDVKAEAVPFEPDRVRNIQTIAKQLWMVGYSQDLFVSQDTALLVERLDHYLENAARHLEIMDMGYICQAGPL
ncbi:Zn(2)-C6 fungal-type domain-containing protein [Mycena venus]|uniref:Zn(2)-C6 fungal-type domain-containing protein n=1 Tax=Mycena venus TaxID=2733690 RepID=A0A8H7DBA3_9AGAR|nr:Zn(2)-C6 fungal-type domain-containing protein [Mycena venus]